MPSMDGYTFEFAELKGKAYYSAYGKVTSNLLHAYRNNKHYETILSSFLQRLFLDPESVSPENFKLLETSLLDRVNDILAEERAHDKERLAKGRKPVYELQHDDEDDYEEEEAETVSAEEMARREAEQLEAERAEAERAAAREAERQRNEEALRQRARQVDAAAVAQLQRAVVLNPGAAKPHAKAGGKSQPTAEDVAEMEAQVALLTCERERLQTVLRSSEEELPALLETVTRERAEARKGGDKSAQEQPAAKAMQQKQLNARVAELKQKITKLTTERSRLALQLKAEPHPLREEVLAVMQERDEARLKLAQHK